MSNGPGHPLFGAQPAGGPGAGGADPSMEDILASIRRILSEDETPAPADAAPRSLPSDQPLVLDASMLVREPQVRAPILSESPLAGLNAIVPPAIVSPGMEPTVPHTATPFTASEPAPAERSTIDPSAGDPAPAEMAPLLAALPSHAELVAPEVAAAASASMGELLRTLTAERQSAVYRGGPTIEDVVREEMRPLLKQWLDTHLPPMVERLVRSEIERVVGRAVS